MPTSPPTRTAVNPTMAVGRMKVEELRGALGRRGLDDTGLKAVLAARLIAAIEPAQTVDQAVIGSGSSSSSKEGKSGGKGGGKGGSKGGGKKTKKKAKTAKNAKGVGSSSSADGVEEELRSIEEDMNKVLRALRIDAAPPAWQMITCQSFY